ncbi:MAG: hypothetical protein G8D89_20865 [gamma proteobacterium symbiont of Clathrolucina costata]
MKTLIIFLSLSILVAIFIKVTRKPSIRRVSNPLSLLEGAVCFMNEQNIKTLTPVPLHGRVDQVFKLRDGRLLILDTKVRERVKAYPSDIVQLTVYAIILKYQGHNVCPFALLRFPLPDNKAAYLYVNLYPESKIIALYQRYQAIKNRYLKPRCTCHKHKV